MEESFSVDLVDQSKRHIRFLRNLHKHGVTLSRPSDESFRRYQLWLKFVFKYSYDNDARKEDASSLIPPADVSWLWHCHRLAPYRYAHYVEKEFFQSSQSNKKPTSSTLNVIDASHPFVFQLKNNETNETFSIEEHGKISERTMQYFQEMYPSEPFFLNESVTEDSVSSQSDDSTNTGTSTDTKLAGFDVIESCVRQSTFLWQVSSPNFHNVEFLQKGTENYAKFVQLMGEKIRPQFLVPTYQIDLMWHTHMLASISNYHRDNMRMNGCTLEHDDSLNDRSEGGKLDTNFQETRKLWSRVYGVEYKVQGGMYRGEPPMEYYNVDWLDKPLDEMKTFSAEGVAFAHLIGQVGASSHGKSTWHSIDSAGMFLAPAAKSITRGVNNNARKVGMIFGRGGESLYDMILSHSPFEHGTLSLINQLISY